MPGANRRWRLQFRCRGSRRESAVAQLSTLARDNPATAMRIFLYLEKRSTRSMDSAENPQLIKSKQLKTPLKRIHWLKENQT